MSRKSYLKAKALNIPKVLLIVIMDILTVTGSYFGALWFRFDCKFSEIPQNYFDTFLKIIPIWGIISIVVFACFGLYNSIWHFVGTDEVIRVGGAYAVLFVIGLLIIAANNIRMPRSFYAVGFVLSLFVTTGIRFSYRLIDALRAQLSHMRKTQK